MKPLLGKSCKIELLHNKQSLFFTVNKVDFISETHIAFIDKYQDYYIYPIKDIVRVSDVR